MNNTCAYVKDSSDECMCGEVPNGKAMGIRYLYMAPELYLLVAPYHPLTGVK